MSPNRDDVALVVIDTDVPVDEFNLVPDPTSPDEALKRISGVLSLDDIVNMYGGQDVFKLGRTSALTRGRLVGVEADSCFIRLPDRRTYLYEGLLVIRRLGPKAFSQAGDSGALVYTADFKAVGLIVGGNDDYSWAAPLATCLDAVSATLLI